MMAILKIGLTHRNTEGNRKTKPISLLEEEMTKC